MLCPFRYREMTAVEETRRVKPEYVANEGLDGVNIMTVKGVQDAKSRRVQAELTESTSPLISVMVQLSDPTRS